MTMNSRCGKPIRHWESCCWYFWFFDVLLAVCLQDSVLAFHKHGMQGRSFKANEVSIWHKELKEVVHCVSKIGFLLELGYHSLSYIEVDLIFSRLRKKYVIEPEISGYWALTGRELIANDLIRFISQV